VFSVEGACPLSKLVRAELDSCRVSGINVIQSQVRFRFVKDLAVPHGAARSGVLDVFENGYFAKHTGLAYVAERNPTENMLTVSVLTGQKNPVRYSVPYFVENTKLLNWNYLSSLETQAKNFVYGLFNYVAESGLLDNGATFIHSSAIERNGSATLVAGRGGVGKTTAMLKCVLERDYRYLSDDLSLIDASSNIWRTPQSMQVYGYNTAGEPAIEDALLRNRSASDRLAWRARLALKGGHRVRRRVSAEELVGESKVGTRSKVGSAIFLERWTSSTFSIQDMSGAEFAQRSANIIVDELSTFIDVSLSEHSSSNRPITRSLADTQSQAMKIIDKAMTGVRCRLVRVPIKANPKQLLEALCTEFDAA